VNGRLGKRYARALLEVAREGSALQAFGDQLGRVVSAFDEPRLRLLVLSPVIDASVRVQTATAVGGALGVVPALVNLLGLLAARNRLAILPDIARWYETFLDEELDRARVTIRSASPLATAERNELVELARRLGGRREILATVEVDPELLGGVVLDIGGMVYDGSVRTELARLTREMTEGGA
jgi:F-type H+-transporting ATPase subunit delta